MIKFAVSCIIFLLLFAVQTSLINSLPGILSLLPVFFAVSIYLIQHHSLWIGILWLIVFGMFLDISNIGDAPFETISYGLASLVALITSRNVFSNRSLYGIIGCGVSSFITLAVCQLGLIFILNLDASLSLDWSALIIEISWKLVGMIILLVTLFQFAKRIRSILIRTFLLSYKHETL